MKRKHFTKPPHLTTFGNWLFAELFTRNITINEMAQKLEISRTTLVGYMQQHPTPIPGYRVLQMCAILTTNIMDYHNMVPEAMRSMPNYYTIYNQQQPQDKTCQQ